MMLSSRRCGSGDRMTGPRVFTSHGRGSAPATGVRGPFARRDRAVRGSPCVAGDGGSERCVKTPVTFPPKALDFSQLIRAGETIGWAEATAEPVFLTRLLDAQAERCRHSACFSR